MNEATPNPALPPSEHGQAADRLLPLVYDELRRMAAGKMAQERSGHTLQATALVHEAWLKLVGSGNPIFQSKAHFFAAAAEAMRRILVDSARRKQSNKRGSNVEHLDLQEEQLASPPGEELIQVDDALDLLAVEDPQTANLIKLRYFVGMTTEEAAAALDLPVRTAGRLWTYGRAWLRREIER